MILETENPQEAKVSFRVRLRGMLRLIRVHNVGFLARRLKCLADKNLNMTRTEVRILSFFQFILDNSFMCCSYI